MLSICHKVKPTRIFVTMKRAYIWILSVIIAVCFIGLLTLQGAFVQRMAQERTELFDQIVNNCITRVILDLENKEYYPEEELFPIDPLLSMEGATGIFQKEQLDISIKSNPESGSAEIVGTYEKSIFTKPERSKKIGANGNDNLASRQQAMLQKAYNRYQQKAGKTEVVNRILQSESKDLQDRIDFEMLNIELGKEFYDNGITLPFNFSVVNYLGDTVYRDENYIVTNSRANYKRHLFPNDIHPKGHFLAVYFPTKRSYILQSMSLATPSMIFAVLLIITVIITVYVLFRQKKLSEIKNDFINNMTHEFKTPISTISLASQMLKDNGVSKTPQNLGHISRVIHDETKRLSYQVEKVLQMAIFDRDKSPLKFKELDINELIHSVVSNFSIKVESRNGVITEDLQALRCNIPLDEMHFTNVIFNLLDNALKYCQREPKLEIKTWNEKQKVCISVKDNGIGIKKEDLKRVFDKFYRVPTGNLHNVKGFGLGLAYVRKIVNEHEGTIRVESDINVGTTFIICLPLKSQ